MFNKVLETVPVEQKVLAKAEKIKLDRSRLLGALVLNKAASLYADDDRCHTGVIKKFKWSVMKDIKSGSKFCNSLVKDPIEAETGLNDVGHNNFISDDRDLNDLTVLYG